MEELERGWLPSARLRGGRSSTSPLVLVEPLSGNDEPGGGVDELPQPWSLEASYQNRQLAERRAHLPWRRLLLQEDASDRRELLVAGETLVVPVNAVLGISVRITDTSNRY